MKQPDPTIIAFKSAALGGILLAAIFLAISYDQLRVPGIYIGSICIFHFSEFFTTSIFNPTTVDNDSFILGDMDLHIVHGVSLLEYTLRNYFISSLTSFSLGLIIAVVGQTIRLFAMCTAGESFHHYVQREKADNHKLVTNGVYAISRHPLYFGFWWWFVGLELWMGNYITLVVGGYKLWNFFKSRIQFEEEFLVKFFGDAYKKYRQSVGVYIPFIS